MSHPNLHQNILIKLKIWFTTTVLLPFASKNDIEALKSFAVTMAIAFPVVFMLILPWLFNLGIPNWPLYIAIALTGLYIFKPSLLYYPYVVWMLIASVFGYINTRIILALAYYILIVPIGLIMQLRKGLQYKHKKQVKKQVSNWVMRDKAPKKENLKEPF